MHRQGKILIVDDNPTNVEILEKLLHHDHQLAVATTGEEALSLAPDFQPELILLDIMMPGIDGYETCRQLRTLSVLRHTKIIMVSAKALTAERLQGYEAGADDYIIKPFDKHELRAKVQVYLRLKSVEEVERLKTDLLTLMQHETRTPLNGLLPPLQILLGEDHLDAAERTIYLELMQQSAMRLQRLLDKGITLSTLKAGTWDFTFAPSDLCEVVEAAVARIAADAAVRRVQIVQELPESAITLLDGEQMQEVVETLLDNAIRFSLPDSRVVVRVTREDSHYCMAVIDQGTGIDAAFLPYVFEEFAAQDVHHHTEGQNLSLAIARQIVLAHNGVISAESEKESGTTFRVRAPILSGVQAEG